MIFLNVFLNSLENLTCLEAWQKMKKDDKIFIRRILYIIFYQVLFVKYYFMQMYLNKHIYIYIYLFQN